MAYLTEFWCLYVGVKGHLVHQTDAVFPHPILKVKHLFMVATTAPSQLIVRMAEERGSSHSKAAAAAALRCNRSSRRTQQCTARAIYRAEKSTGDLKKITPGNNFVLPRECPWKQQCVAWAQRSLRLARHLLQVYLKLWRSLQETRYNKSRTVSAIVWPSLVRNGEVQCHFAKSTTYILWVHDTNAAMQDCRPLLLQTPQSY